MSKRSLLLFVMAIVAILGAINAGYLSLMALSGEAPNCNFIQGCDLVAASPHSKIFGVPLALFGVFFYSIAFGFILWAFFSRARHILLLLGGIVTLGFILSLYFLYLQAVVIQAYCEYCLFSLFDATVLFILSGILLLLDRRDIKQRIVDAETATAVYNNDI